MIKKQKGLVESTDSTTLSNFAILPAFSFGFSNSFNPCALALLMVFLLWIAKYGTSNRRIVIMGLFFILGCIIMNVSFVFGLYDLIIKNPTIINVSRMINIVLSILFFIVGVRLFIQWYQSKTKVCILPYYIYSEDNDYNKFFQKNKISIRGFFSNIGLILLSGAFGLIVSFFGFFWSKDYEMYMMVFQDLQKGYKIEAFFSVFTYTLGIVFPVIIAWNVILGIAFKKKIGKKVYQYSSYVKLISSAVLISTGLGLFGWFLF